MRILGGRIPISSIYGSSLRPWEGYALSNREQQALNEISEAEIFTHSSTLTATYATSSSSSSHNAVAQSVFTPVRAGLKFVPPKLC